MITHYYIKQTARNMWDFPESSLNGDFTRRGRSHSDGKIAKRFILLLRDRVAGICVKIKTGQFNDKGLNLLLKYHEHNCDIREMPKCAAIHYLGMNKPKGVHRTDFEKIGEDGSLRADKRVIFIALCDIDGNWRSESEIIATCIHELAHTCCNHVTWRNDNHGSDFKKYEKRLTCL